MGRTFLFFTALFLSTAVSAAAGPASAQQTTTVLSQAGPVRVVDLAGKAVNPLVLPPGRVATVLVFTTTDCPISNRYAPDIEGLAKTFQAQGIAFTLVYPVKTDTPAVIREHVKKFGYGVAVVRDTGQELVAHTAVTVTPEVAVIGAGGQVLYRGRIDDRYVDFGKERPHPTDRSLERALDAIVKGKPVPVRTTQAVGCFLPDLLK